MRSPKCPLHGRPMKWKGPSSIPGRQRYECTLKVRIRPEDGVSYDAPCGWAELVVWKDGAK
jgi:hypothetical protein